MSANRVDSAKPAEGAEKKPAEGGAVAAPAAGGGVKAFLPLIVNLLLMPALAWVMTTKVLVPSLLKQAGAAKTEAAGGEHSEGGEAAHGEAKEEKKEEGSKEHGAGGEKSGPKNTVSMNKLIVNVAGTLGTRYIVASLTLSGAPSIKERYEKHEFELRDAACSAMSTKTISDMEKPGFRNTLRAELVALFNGIMGKGSVSEIYLTDFAIQ